MRNKGHDMNGHTPISAYTEGMLKSINTAEASQTEATMLKASLGLLKMRLLL